MSATHTGERSAESRLGPYRLLREIGSGGMGIVHLALDPRDRQVAIKVLRPHVAADPQARARLEREVGTLQRVSHPCVSRVLDHDLAGPHPYLVTEYVDGPALDQLVERRGRLTPRRVLPVAGGLAEALTAIHTAGVVHRDVKPGNVLMASDGRAVLIDFGIAQAADDLRLTQTGMVIGTPGYLAPELIRGESITAAADWWAWAATVAYACTGHKPFGGGPFHAVLARVCDGQADLTGMDPRLRPLIAALLSPHPLSRPDTEDVMLGLHRFAEGREALVSANRSVTTVVPVSQVEPPRTHTRTITRDQPVQPGPVPVPPGQYGPYGPGAPTARADWHDRGELAPAPIPGTAAPVSLPPVRIGPQGSTGLPVRAAAGPVGPVRREQLTPWPDDPAPEPAPPPAFAPRDTAPATRRAAAVGLLAIGVALAVLYPVIAAVVLAVLFAAARTVAASVDTGRRRETAGRRGGAALRVVLSPWHLVRGVVVTALAALLPLACGAAAGFAIALATAFLADQNALVLPLALLAGAAAFVVASWWLPGAASLREGTDHLVRVLLPWDVLRVVVAVVGIAAVVVCALAAVLGAVHPDPLPFPIPDWLIPYT